MEEESSTIQSDEVENPPNFQIPYDLFVSKKYKGLGTRGILRFTDSAGNLVYTVKKLPHCIKLVLDSSGDALFSIHRISKGSWQGFRGNGEEKDLIFTVDKTLDEFTRTEFKILLGEKNDDPKTELLMKGCPFKRSCTIYKGNSIVAESSLMHKLGIAKLFVTRNRFRVTIFPGVADLTMGEVDPSFIQALAHRPKHHSIEAENIPIIDLSPLKALPPPDADTQLNLAAQIGGACRKWGFFQVINHGVPSKLRQRIESASRKFFALPKEEKMKVGRDKGNPFGYYDSEHTKNVRDWKEVFDFAVSDPIVFPSSHESDDIGVKELTNKWPHNLPEFREACEEHTAEMEKLAFRLLELIALSLGLPKDRLTNGFFFENQTSRVRLNYYPPCPAPHLTLGVGRHKDTGILTILAQDDVAGLEVKRKADGEWILVKPTPDAYIVNVGDIIQVWSNDLYESVEHRAVVNSEKERLSIPYFLYPSHYTWIEPLEELINVENPARFKAYNWGKFRATRNRGNFDKLDVENIQISHFRI